MSCSPLNKVCVELNVSFILLLLFGIIGMLVCLERIVMTLTALGGGSQGMSLLAKHPVALFSVCEKHRKCTRAIHICEMRKKVDFLNSEYSKEYRHASGKIYGRCFFFFFFETRDILF